jgi:hypothetical protein
MVARKPISKIGPKNVSEAPDVALSRLCRLIEFKAFPLRTCLPSKRELCAQFKVFRAKLRTTLSAMKPHISNMQARLFSWRGPQSAGTFHPIER